MTQQSDRDRGLFTAVVSVAAGLELGATLRRIVQAAVELVDATYGALGVINADGRLGEFVHVGIDGVTAERIGDLPTGNGILGLLVDHPVPIRLENLASHPSSSGFPPGHPEDGVVPRGPGPGTGRGLRQPLPHREAHRHGLHLRGRAHRHGSRCRGRRRHRELATVRAHPPARAVAAGRGRHRQLGARGDGPGGGAGPHRQPCAHAHRCRRGARRPAGRRRGPRRRDRRRPRRGDQPGRA